tara:strand:+ start:14069 stop:14323 length:255 start_codon:yes stop_codon:yes gene_type:complete
MNYYWTVHIRRNNGILEKIKIPLLSIKSVFITNINNVYLYLKTGMVKFTNVNWLQNPMLDLIRSKGIPVLNGVPEFNGDSDNGF